MPGACPPPCRRRYPARAHRAVSVVVLGTLVKPLLEGVAGGGIIAGAAAKGMDAAEKILVGRVLREVETHARPHLGPAGTVGLATTVRLAHCAACLVVLDAHAQREAAEAAMARATPPDSFTTPARLRLHQRLADPGTGPDETDAALTAALDAAARRRARRQDDGCRGTRARRGRRLGRPPRHALRTVYQPGLDLTDGVGCVSR